MQQPSDEIKSKLDIVEVIREYIQLKAAGINFRANCPFHHEKTPSFMVSPEKQIWHCFGCGKGGDVFSFVMEMEGLSFVEALRQLAQKAGVVLKRIDPKLTSQRNRLLDLLEITAKSYHKILLDSPKAEAIRAYLKKRGLNEETIGSWQIGYSLPDWDSTIKLLKGRGFSENEIFLAGLSVKRLERGTIPLSGTAHANYNSDSSFYDRFRGRIMFPIKDINGSVVGFSARVSPVDEGKEKLGKYINSPQTMVYDKSRILFGLDKAKLAIKQNDAGILVEGQMDAITAHQFGFTNVVASSGTALTAGQVALLKRYSQNLFLAFDMDSAGDLATNRGMAQAIQADMNIKVIELAGAKDPDESIRQNPENWLKAVTLAKPMMQYIFDKTFARLNPEKVDEQKQALKILLPQLVKLANRIERDFWLKKLSQATDVEENFLREETARLEKAVKPESAKRPAETADGASPAGKQSREEMLSELLLALIIKFPDHLDYVLSHIGPDHLADEILQTIYKNLIIYYNKAIDFEAAQIDFNKTAEFQNGIRQAEKMGGTAGQFDRQETAGSNFTEKINYLQFKDWLDENLTGLAEEEMSSDDKIAPSACLLRLDRLALLGDKDFYDHSSEQAKTELINIVSALKKNYLVSRLKQITKLISQIESAGSASLDEGNKIKLNTLLEEFRTLTEEIREMEV